MKYKRVLLKVSGEALSGKTPIDFEKATETALQIKALHDAGCLLGVVVGGGNIWRGRSGGTMDRSRADNIGMLATAMNALALEQALIDLNVPVRVLSAVSMDMFMDSYSAREANKSVDAGTVVIFACGSGAPFFSTDTASALRAAQIHADALLLAKMLTEYTPPTRMSVRMQSVMPASVTMKSLQKPQGNRLNGNEFCREYSIPMVLFKMHSAEALVAAVNGENAGTIVDAQPGFELV